MKPETPARTRADRREKFVLQVLSELTGEDEDAIEETMRRTHYIMGAIEEKE